MKQELSGTEKIVLCGLATFHSRQNPNPYPSLSLLAKTAGVSEKTSCRVIAKLGKLGLISIKHSKGRHSNRYELHLEQRLPVRVNTDTESQLPNPNRDAQSAEQGLSVPQTRTHSPTNKVINKDMNKKEGAGAPELGSHQVTEETMWVIGEMLGIPRKVTGRAVSVSSKAKVAEVIGYMAVHTPVEPVSYLMKTVSNSSGIEDMMAGAL